MKNNLIAKNVQEMKGYVPGEQPNGKNVVKLNTNENPYPPSPKVLQKLKSIQAESLRRYPDPVCKTLREVIARKAGCSVGNVFVGNGSDEILALAARAFVDNDGAIGYVEPSYSLYPVIAELHRVSVIPIFTVRDFLLQMPKNYKVSLFYLTNPNAPSGVQYDVEFIKKFCIKMRSGVVLIDEAYVDFASEHALDLAFTLKNVLVMRTLSKSYSLAGLRVGFVFGNEELISALFKVKDSYNVDAIAQQLAIAAIKDEAYFRRIIRAVIAERERTVALLKQLGFEVLPSAANFVFARPPAPVRAEFLFKELKKRDIFVRYFPGKITGDGIRITIGTSNQMAKLFNAIQGIIERC